MEKDVRQIERKALGQYPEAFEDSTLLILHQAFLETARIMREIGPNGKNYWEILHASEELLNAMGHIENAAFEWRSYADHLNEKSEEHVTHCQDCLLIGNTRQINRAVNICHSCKSALCQVHSHPIISDDERDVFVCTACFFSS